MSGEDLDSRIAQTIELVPGINQIQIIGALKHRASKNTIIKHLNGLVNGGSIKRYERGIYVTYTVTYFDSGKRLDKSLRKNLNGISRIIKKTKSDMPGHYHETKEDLNSYFEWAFHDIDARTQSVVATHESMRKSRRPYLISRFDEIEAGLDSLKESNSCSVERLDMLRAAIRKIKERLYKIDDKSMEFYEQLERATDKRSRAAIQKKISGGESEWTQLDRDQEEISRYVKFARDSLDDVAKRMHERYLEGKPDAAAEIRGLLSRQDARGESVLWRILNATAKEAKNANSQKLLRHEELASSTDPDELDRIREHITGWAEIAKEAEMQLNELKEWLAAGNPIYNVGESFLSRFPRFDLTPNDKFEIVMEVFTTDAGPDKICHRHRITRSMLSSWKKKFLEGGKSALA